MVTILEGLVIVYHRLSWWHLKFHLINKMRKIFTYSINTIEIHIFIQENWDILLIVNYHVGKISHVDISGLKVDTGNSFHL
jgi:hypothetical protein